ncbi:MAG: MFS transporter, partial [Chryseobacterium gambrini]|nr:MFS transporter [Chryseobacterium gambrini]
MSNYSKQTNWGQFIPLVTVFFFWGFVAASNDILIPVFQKAFNLSQTESMLVQICFYVAYTVGSLIYMLVSAGLKQDLVNKIGYKNGLIVGLLISAAGTLLFYPAANMHSFPLMISGLFIVGLGFSLQQIVANPLAIEVGPSETGSQRLTMAGGINNLGTTIGPLIVSFAIFGSAAASNNNASVESVKIPYLILGAAFVLVAIMLKFSSLPAVTPTITEDTDDSVKGQHRKSALQYPQLILGMIAIFVYVGVEVSTASNLPAYMEKSLGFETKDVAPYISLYWASLMIGRWTGAVEAFDVSAGFKKILRFLAPYLAFGVFLLVNAIAKHDLSHFYVYGLIIIAMIICDILSKGNPARMLLIFSAAGITALLTGMFT